MVANLRNLEGRIPQREVYGIITHEQQHKFAGEIRNYHTDRIIRKLLHDWYNNFIDIYYDNRLSTNDKNKLLTFWTNIKLEHTNNIGELIWRRSKSLI